MMLTALADVARLAGLTVEEVSGWQTRTRPGGQDSVQTIVCHHTGGLKNLNTIIRGRDIGLPTELPGPLAHFFLARTGVVYVVAAGKCNHAGEVRSPAYANANSIGIEAEAIGIPGTAGDWPPEQMDAYARLCRALHLHYGLSVLDVRGHKEVCAPIGRKSDPDFNMNDFRERVARVNLEDDMPLSDTDVDKLVTALTPVMQTIVHNGTRDLLKNDAIVSNPVTHPSDPPNDPGSVTWALASLYQKTKQQGEQIAAILAAISPPPAP